MNIENNPLRDLNNAQNLPRDPHDPSEGSHISRYDFFAAHALQGLLASGKFTEYNEEGECLWFVLEGKTIYTEDGEPTTRKKNASPAVEMAWRMAEWMVRDEEEYSLWRANYRRPTV